MMAAADRIAALYELIEIAATLGLVAAAAAATALLMWSAIR